ncbi:hypothetical protein PENSPDRAFT_165452 [Peniophora sp. CONT]|nr:hypothetical protein PENSPDRAFT_165452 [Peniophora sp. CONT]
MRFRARIILIKPSRPYCRVQEMETLYARSYAYDPTYTYSTYALHGYLLQNAWPCNYACARTLQREASLHPTFSVQKLIRNAVSAHSSKLPTQLCWREPLAYVQVSPVSVHAYGCCTTRPSRRGRSSRSQAAATKAAVSIHFYTAAAYVGPVCSSRARRPDCPCTVSPGADRSTGEYSIVLLVWEMTGSGRVRCTVVGPARHLLEMILEN